MLNMLYLDTNTEARPVSNRGKKKNSDSVLFWRGPAIRHFVAIPRKDEQSEQKFWN